MPIARYATPTGADGVLASAEAEGASVIEGIAVPATNAATTSAASRLTRRGGWWVRRQAETPEPNDMSPPACVALPRPTLMGISDPALSHSKSRLVHEQRCYQNLG